MNIFRRLKDVLSPPQSIETEKGFVIPFGFTPNEWVDFKELVSRPEWDLYLRALDTLTIFSAEAILAASQDESLHYHRGVVVGLRKAATLPREAVATETLWNEEKNRVSADKRRNSDSRLALYGSPAWKQSSESGARRR